MPHQKLQVSERGMLDAYEARLAERGFQADAQQWAAAECLQRLYTQLLHFKVARGSKVKRIFSPPEPPRGVYFWGGVGRGKSFLMDAFFAAVPYRRKSRVHFHAFMRRIHKELEQFSGEPDPMMRVAQKISRETRLLCFDEFHVSDIADAMILGRLITGLKEAGVVLVMTSNYPPDELYPGGLQRENFLPAIALIKAYMDVVEVDTGVDYRLRAIASAEVYHYPADSKAKAEMEEHFRLAAGEVAGTSPKAGKHESIRIMGRTIPVLRQSNDKEVLWFSFTDLCGSARSQNDYLELAAFCRVLLVSGVPLMTQYQSAEARRFTWLVDVCYEHRIKLVLTADCEAEKLYIAGVGANEFARTVSRLQEMRSREYLDMPVIRIEK
ncbi:MAG: cell division protein ZapE [Betaproteobacteria bacterium]|nr:cell division protein ZapE [Betaproteobacteria bacterium]